MGTPQGNPPTPSSYIWALPGNLWLFTQPQDLLTLTFFWGHPHPYRQFVGGMAGLPLDWHQALVLSKQSMHLRPSISVSDVHIQMSHFSSFPNQAGGVQTLHLQCLGPACSRRQTSATPAFSRCRSRVASGKEITASLLITSFPRFLASSYVA